MSLQMTTSTIDVTVLGRIQPDGSLQLDEPVDLPPGPIEVTLRRIPAQASTELKRLPDEPWLDECISPPFDLPHPEGGRPVQVHRGGVRLPDPGFAEELSEK